MKKIWIIGAAISLTLILGKKIKKILVTTGIITMFSLGLVGNTNKIPFGITAYASEQTLSQSSRWEGQGDIWRLKSSNGTYVTNSWVEDGGAWYLLDEQGYMRTNLVYDSITNAYYMLNPNHDGTYGRMLDKAGTYKVNNIDVYMAFNQSHDGTYGKVIEGLENLKATGIKTTTVNGLPSASVGSSTSSNTGNNTNKDTTDNSNNSDNNSSGYYNEDGYWISTDITDPNDYADQNGGGGTGSSGRTNAY